jgi:hypothetical protein
MGKRLRYVALNIQRLPLKGVLLLLLSVDTAFIAVNVLYSGESSNFYIDTDRGYPEMFVYGKEALIVLLIALVAILCRSLLYLCWSLLFLFLLLDDSLQIHEILGLVVAQKLGFSSWLGLSPQDFGEVAVWLFFGLPPLLAIAILQILSHDRKLVAWSRYLLVLLGALVLTGGVFDMLGQVFQDHSLLDPLFRVADDGGAMAVWSATLWLVLLIAQDSLASGINRR